MRRFRPLATISWASRAVSAATMMASGSAWRQRAAEAAESSRTEILLATYVRVATWGSKVGGRSGNRRLFREGGARENVKSLGQREELDFRFGVSWILKLKLIMDKKRSMTKSILIGGRRVHGKALTSGF